MALAVLHALLAADDAATEGKKVITGMLIVGLIFVGVIALGETLEWLRHRRRAPHRPRARKRAPKVLRDIRAPDPH